MCGCADFRCADDYEDLTIFRKLSNLFGFIKAFYMIRRLSSFMNCLTNHKMFYTEKNEELKKEILSSPNQHGLIDKLIELEGFEAMQFFQSMFLLDPFQRDEGSKILASAAAYGVKRLLSIRALESVDDFKFCPVCKSALHKYDTPDLYSVGLKCSNNHRFHVDIRQNEFFEKDRAVNDENTINIAKTWLSNEDYRKCIHSQIAEILRKYIEINDFPQQQENQNTSENYCPGCSLDLVEFEQDDVWVRGLECTNKHTFYSRNGLSYKNSTLKPDISKTDLYFLIDGYLNSEQKDHLPNQIVVLFRTIMLERQ